MTAHLATAFVAKEMTAAGYRVIAGPFGAAVHPPARTTDTREFWCCCREESMPSAEP